MNRASLSITVLSVFLALNLLGCQSKTLPNPLPTSTYRIETNTPSNVQQNTLSSPVVVMPSTRTKEGYRIAPMAKLTGPLNLKDNCLMIGNQVVVFPAETTSWDAQSQILNLGKTAYRLGDMLSIGGGEFDFSSLKPQPPINCKVDKVWLM